MKIGFDARAIPYRKGIATYSRNLLQQFAEAGLDVVVFCPDDEKHTIPPAASFTLVSANMNPLASHAKAGFRALLKESKIDLLHVPSPWAATPVPVPLVSTMHDVTPFLYPRSVPFHLRLSYKRQLNKTLAESRRVITVSQILCSALSIYASVDATKVRVIHNGVAERFSPQTDEGVLRAVRHRYSLPERYVFWAGEFRHEKNLHFLIQAWSRMQKRMADPPVLVMAGAQNIDYRKLRRAVVKRGLEGKVLFPGFINFQDLPAVYSAATLFVFPSLAEGFGLPPLEAMACGTPCVVSNSSSLPEVTGSAALLFDPTSLDAFEDCVNRALTQPDLREHMREQGLRQAARFSWKRSAEETIQVYRSALAG